MNIFTRFKAMGRLLIWLPLILTCLTVKLQAQEELIGLSSNGGQEGKGTAFSIMTNGTGFSIIKGFADWGAGPLGHLVRGADGNMYGTSYQGGTYGHGTIFKVTSAGVVTVLKHLNLSVDGGYPKGSLLLASDGNFYGTVSGGSPNNGGAIFRITPAGVYTIVRSLSINTDGGRPAGSLIQATDGNLYGLNYAGGASSYGTIFRLSLTGVYTVLKVFNNVDGSNPYGSLVQATDGNFYGMTYGGGTVKFGVIFKMTPAGVYTILRSFNGTTDGGYPLGSLVQGKDGLLYGMATARGGFSNGTVFKISTAGVFTLLKALSATVEGAGPEGHLIQASDGNFYGMTAYSSGGTNGTVFKMTPAGVITVLNKFVSATTGAGPAGSLYQHTDGNFYGMTNSGGTNFYGTIFKITPAGVTTVISHLSGASHGNEPQDRLVLGKDSAYYGTTRFGGTKNHGTIFKICGGITSVLRHLDKNITGGNPVGSLLRAADGNFYGTTETGGTNGAGTIFRITPTGALTVIRHLAANTDGGYPKGSLVQGTDGALYGMTSSGGTGAGGTVFKITTAGVYTVLRHLAYATDGSNPEGDLVFGKDGNLYGMTYNASRFFRVTTAGVFTVLTTFNSTTQGSYPTGGLILAKDGNFYGTHTTGGTNRGGTIFRITTAGAVTVLRHLNPATDGSVPKGTLLQATDGNLYGLTSAGGTFNSGTIFRVTTGGAYTVLRQMNIATDGAAAFGGMILAPKNNLVALPQANLALKEDGTLAVVLKGTGTTTPVFNIAVAPRNGTLTGTGANRVYKPKLNYNGRDSFAFTISVGCLSSKPAYVSFNIAAVNDTPVLAPIGPKTATRGVAMTFRATATDVDAGQTKTFSLLTPPAGALINATTGTFTWTPATAGKFSVKVRVTDNGSPTLYDEETVVVTVANPPTGLASGSGAMTKTGIVHTNTLYPNPVSGGQCSIVLEENFEHVNTIITDTKGTEVLRNIHSIAGGNRLDLDVTKLRPGIYIVQVRTENSQQSFRFIKQ
jgi:uncharacterized repeat protein (TIGR03803 family)